ncbi:glycosyltransferase [Adlercreutzia sp. ZJ138]|uniref:glycosyltransferase n=1 Tax=Adlercreutzia sp. ZJ138 TaxID=2709405 RepID=UPI0013EB97DC|nr:glycosyltransferase family 2 protein [Adlercreutzia sp. ZJ138]
MQFITLTFNHEKFIIEHLESIKFQIERFASEPCSVLVVDDCSGDETVNKANVWIAKNRGLFQSAEVVSSQRNEGLTRNFIKAISLVKEDRFKILAGDDLYAMNNVFDAVGKFDLFETPIIPFTDSQGVEYSIKTGLEFYYRYERRPVSIKLIKTNLSKGYFFSAPGVFVSRQIVKDDGLQEYILQFRNIEDLPMWHYLLNIQSNPITIGRAAVPYVMYRVGSGISTSPTHESASQFRVEEEKIRRIACPNSGQKARWGRIIKIAAYLPVYMMGIGKIGACKKKYKHQWANAARYLTYIQACASDFEYEGAERSRFSVDDSSKSLI